MKSERELSMSQKQKNSLKSIFIDLVASGTAASIAKTICAPLERVNLINQTMPGRYKGFVDCLVNLPKEEGNILTFWRGNCANILRYVPTQTLNFTINGFLKNLFMPLGQRNYSYGQGLLEDYVLVDLLVLCHYYLLIH